MLHYRNIQSPQVYGKYIPKPQNKKVYLGSGQALFSVNQMQEWAYKHANEAKAIAPQLNAPTLEQTAKNIHKFLYQNFQYKEDGSQQQLRSLAQAWNERETGIDCKSYSIIASQILLILGIPHAFRIVKQKNDGSRPNGWENTWSHVFVVIPTKNKTLAIDGVIPNFGHPTQVTEYKDFAMTPQQSTLNGCIAAEKPNFLAPTILSQADFNQIKAKLKTPKIIDVRKEGPRVMLLVDGLEPEQLVRLEATAANIKKLETLGCACSLGRSLTFDKSKSPQVAADLAPLLQEAPQPTPTTNTPTVNNKNLFGFTSTQIGIAAASFIGILLTAVYVKSKNKPLTI